MNRTVKPPPRVSPQGSDSFPQRDFNADVEMEMRKLEANLRKELLEMEYAKTANQIPYPNPKPTNDERMSMSPRTQIPDYSAAEPRVEMRVSENRKNNSKSPTRGKGGAIANLFETDVEKKRAEKISRQENYRQQLNQQVVHVIQI